jgi:hypothetical protein
MRQDPIGCIAVMRVQSTFCRIEVSTTAASVRMRARLKGGEMMEILMQSCNAWRVHHQGSLATEALQLDLIARV